MTKATCASSGSGTQLHGFTIRASVVATSQFTGNSSTFELAQLGSRLDLCGGVQHAKGNTVNRSCRLRVLGEGHRRVRAAGGLRLRVLHAAAVTLAGLAGPAVDDRRLGERAALGFAIGLFARMRRRCAEGHQCAEPDRRCGEGGGHELGHGSMVKSTKQFRNRADGRFHSECGRVSGYGSTVFINITL